MATSFEPAQLNAREVSPQESSEIADLIHRYFWLVDNGRASEVADLFASAGTLEFAEGAPTPGTLSRKDIDSAMIQRQSLNVVTRHVVSNLMLSKLSETEINSSCLLTLYRSDDKFGDTYPVSVADIIDTFSREHGKWKIQHRIIAPIFNNS